MKGLSERKRMKFSFFFVEYFLSFQRYSSFCSKIVDVTNHFSTKINPKIKNISGNIGVLLLKLGTNNVHQVRNKITPNFDVAMVLLSVPVPSAMNQLSPIFDHIRRGRQSYLETHEVPILPYVSTTAHWD